MKNPSQDELFAATLADPLRFIALCWPELMLYDKQREILLSVRDNPETFVHAAHKTGKTLIAAAIAIWFLVSRTPSKVVITSSSEDQLRRVLWSQIRQLIKTSKVPLPLEIQDLEIRRFVDNGRKKTFNGDVLIGLAPNKVESFQGHHLPNDRPRVLAVMDEASGVADEMYEAAPSWAHRMLVVGNPLSLTNFFFRLCRAGNTIDPAGESEFLRKVIHISSRDVPNVARGLLRREKGLDGPFNPLIPGLLTYPEYIRRLAEWDERERTIRLEGQFYEGEGVLLFPPDCLDQACDRRRWLELSAGPRKAVAMGIDVAADGPDFTVWTIVDQFGIIKQIKMSTPNTMEIVGRTIELLRQYDLSATVVAMDIGGGGKQLADRLKEQGYHVRTVHFGESADDKQAYPNRRVEMYANLMDLFEPRPELGVFNLGDDSDELRQELAVFPKVFDSSGRIVLPPKRPGRSGNGQTSIQKILGHSPDRADSLALAAWMLKRLMPTLGPKLVVAYYGPGGSYGILSAEQYDALTREEKIAFENNRQDWIDEFDD